MTSPKRTFPILIILLLLVFTKTNAQQLEFFQGINFSKFGKSNTRYENSIYKTKPAVGFDFGVAFWVRPNNKNLVMVSLHLFHQKGRAEYIYENRERYFASLVYNTQHIVIGLQPYTFVSRNKRLEIGVALEMAFLIQDLSKEYETAIVLFPRLNETYLEVDRKSTKDIGISGKLNLGYVFDLKNNCQFIPRITFRLLDLKYNHFIHDERSIGLEFGFRF